MSETSSLFDDRNLFRSVVDASPAGMVIADADGTIVLANPAASSQFGYEIDELTGMSVDDLLPETHRPAHGSHRARYMAHPEHRSMAAGRNLFAMRKDGSTFPVDISLHPIKVGGQQMVLANVLDATDRRRAEQEREQRQAMERLALLGQLAGGVAHEIRTPLSVIRNDAYYLQLLEEQLGGEGIQCVKEINVAVGKAERIVNELLDFTRDLPCEPATVSLAHLIDAAIQAVSVPDTVTIARDGPQESNVWVDADQVERILVNLIRNAVQAIGESGTVRIVTKVREETASIAVIDDGPGIASAVLEQVFEPLFSTKPRGIGLGLAVSRRYAEGNGGTLTASNAESGGACFELELPTKR